ncbi:MAG: Hsp70 family protein, partial [Pusillimonas sp.]|nr:Hsp70 family protein [Pusillimonas sp.]
VTFDIDANGILHVSAKDKGTGKENKITIKANSGLTDEEIDRMVKDAEANAEDDRRLAELATSRNQAEALVHSTRKSLEEYGEKLEASEKEAIEAAIKEAEEVIKDGDKEAIDAKVEALTAASQKLGEKMYADMQAQAAAQQGADAATTQQPEDENVVDADFKEVKRDDK